MKICIIGKGNVGTMLTTAYRRKGTDVIPVDSRSCEGLPSDASLYLIAVKDDSIRDVAERLKPQLPEGATVAHTSGSVGIEVLKEVYDDCGVRSGVMYPLQTFTKGVGMSYKDIPFLIEGEDERTELKLRQIARLLSRNVREADSSQRAEYHLAAVIACNFSTYLCGLAEQYLKEKDLDFKMLLPLMKQTVKKLETLTPVEALTGPAARGDMSVIDRQLEKLSGFPEIKEVYSLVTNNIVKSKSYLNK